MTAAIDIPANSEIPGDALQPSVYELRLFTAAEYQQLAGLGIFGEDERIELIEGRIVRMTPKNVDHAVATRRALRIFSRAAGELALISVQDPILLNDRSEPEPDVTLVAGPDTKYLEHHPAPNDIFLVLEIADSSLAFDREVKGPLYGRNGIRQFCLLNLQDRELEDYRDPGPHGFRGKQTYGEDEAFSLVAFPMISIKVGDLLPPKPAGKHRQKEERRRNKQK